MAILQKLPLRGLFGEASMFFLRDNGFQNIEACSDKSVWVSKGIQIHIDEKDDVVGYPKLFDLIYDSGVSYGKYIERKTLLNATTNFIQNYGKSGEQNHY